MEQYKQEFIEFMVESRCFKIWRVYLEERQKVSVFYECRSICDRFPVKETWRVLCKSNSR